MGTDNFFNEYIVQGGLTMLVLVPLSIYTFGLIIQKYLELRRSKIISQEIIERAQRVSSQASFEEFYAFLKNKPTPLANIVIGYIELGLRGESTNPDEDLTPIDDEAEYLYQSLNPISTSYVVAPLIGVLGTTVGIMGTFKQFAMVGKRDMGALVSAIDKSLITTMWGLFIAVPAYFFFSALQSKIFFYERKIFPALIKDIMKDLRPFIQP
jgi:biopolymer transport protein ExbB